MIADTLARFERWILKPLRSDVRKHRSRNHFSSFILLAVAIDNLASFRYLGVIPGNDKAGKRYRTFIENYMPTHKAHADMLWKGFRCKLVHQFQLKGFDIRQSKESKKLHLSIVENGNVCLNSLRFVKELFVAFRRLKNELIGRRPKKDVVESFIKGGFGSWSHTG